MEDEKRKGDPAGSAGQVQDKARIAGSQALHIPWIPVKQVTPSKACLRAGLFLASKQGLSLLSMTL